MKLVFCCIFLFATSVHAERFDDHSSTRGFDTPRARTQEYVPDHGSRTHQQIVDMDQDIRAHRSFKYADTIHDGQGGLVPDFGYSWSDHPYGIFVKDPKEKDVNLKVVWRPGMVFEEIHIMTGRKPGTFQPEPGYHWDDEAKPVISLAEVGAAIALFAATQKLVEKADKEFGYLMPSKDPVFSSSSKEGANSSDKATAEKPSSWGGGTGGGRSTGRNAQDRL